MANQTESGRRPASATFRDWAVGIAALLSSVLFPALGIYYTDQQKSDELALEYVRLSIGLLQNRAGEAKASESVRDWAMKTLNAHAPIQMSDETKAAVLAGGIRTVSIPVAVSCAADPGPDPSYPDTDAALRSAPDVFEGTKLLMAGRELRAAREQELKAALSGCLAMSKN